VVLHYTLIVFCLGFTLLGSAQFDELKFHDAKVLERNGNFEASKEVLRKEFANDTNNIEFALFNAILDSRLYRTKSSLSRLIQVEKILEAQHPNSDKLEFYWFKTFLGKAFNYDVDRKFDLALKYYLKADSLSKHNLNLDDFATLHGRRLLLYSAKGRWKDAEELRIKYQSKVDSINDPRLYSYFHNQLGTHYHYARNGPMAIYHLNESQKITEKLFDTVLLVNNLFTKGIVFNEHMDNRDLSLEYYMTSLELCDCPDRELLQTTGNYNISRIFKGKKKIALQKEYLHKTRQYANSARQLHTKNNVFRDLYEIYDIEQNIDSAYYYLKLHKIYTDSLGVIDREKKFAELQSKFNVAEKERLLLISEKNEKQSRNLATALGGGLLGASLIGFLLFKNTKRKQRIAEQERELEIQKKEKILKDQELNAIDAMIEGQEKERQRLASDLHDSVGATLSAAKLQFDHLSKNKDKLEDMDELFSKTKTLLDDAYTEVRSMAHLKNSGVIAKKGLLPAIEKLAKNASGTNNLKVEVQDFGLDEKLEASLEISIFRIIQELVTNIIKHAHATEATISITQHEDTLSIIVEDNGVGFNARKIHKKDGMGLSSIEKRVEHLEGTLEVDATPGKGTTILIDIPL